MQLKLCYLFIFCSFWSCKPNDKQTQTAFYYWRQNLALSAQEKTVLENCRTQQLYIRLFDIVFNPNSRLPQPIADITIADTSGITKMDIIPCVFIVNNVFRHMTPVQTDSLASATVKRIKAHCSKFKPIKEIQIDCDWTTGTKELYFRFLNQVKTFSGLKISATIRLHQVKYISKSGIPPVDKGVLMCYNMSPPQVFGELNSIFEKRTLESYTRNLSNYPLKLDIALPIYSWGILFHNKEFNGFINNITSAGMAGYSNLKAIGKNNYLCTESGTVKNKRVYKGDIIRIEDISNAELNDAKTELLRKTNSSTVIYFDLSKNNINNHEEVFSPAYSFR